MRVEVKFDKTIYMYLIIVDWMAKAKYELLRAEPTDRFLEMVREHVLAYAIKEEKPPEAIATAIMNCADEMMAGREVVLRAGDYISLMSYAREQKLIQDIDQSGRKEFLYYLFFRSQWDVYKAHIEFC